MFIYKACRRETIELAILSTLPSVVDDDDDDGDEDEDDNDNDDNDNNNNNDEDNDKL